MGDVIRQGHVPTVLYYAGYGGRSLGAGAAGSGPVQNYPGTLTALWRNHRALYPIHKRFVSPLFAISTASLAAR